jgi:hypothetical protein
MSIRILVTYKGEVGYLVSETGIDLRTRYGVTFDSTRTATYQDRGRAERMAAKVINRFERVEIEEEWSTETTRHQ